MTTDKFYEKYTVVKNPLLKDAPWDGGMLETFGEEYELVKKQMDKNPKTVWTVIDTNDGWYGIVAGWHWVNRIGYLVTEQEWENEFEEYEDK